MNIIIVILGAVAELVQYLTIVSASVVQNPAGRDQQMALQLSLIITIAPRVRTRSGKDIGYGQCFRWVSTGFYKAIKRNVRLKRRHILVTDGASPACSQDNMCNASLVKRFVGLSSSIQLVINCYSLVRILKVLLSAKQYLWTFVFIINSALAVPQKSSTYSAYKVYFFSSILKPNYTSLKCLSTLAAKVWQLI